MSAKDKVAEYRKGIVAVVGVALTWASMNGIVLPEFLTQEWVRDLLTILTPLAVILIPNSPPKPKA